ncbi:MAG TPA: hypothetical protein ENF81_03900 [Thermotogaceae bacterium]|nr:hypothetical protein [Thermotogaceae bacterium]
MLKYGISFYSENVEPAELAESVKKFLSSREEKGTLGKTEISVYIGPEDFVTVTFKTYPKKGLDMSEARRKAAKVIIEFSKYLPSVTGDIEVFIEDVDGIRSLSFPLEANT